MLARFTATVINDCGLLLLTFFRNGAAGGSALAEVDIDTRRASIDSHSGEAPKHASEHTLEEAKKDFQVGELLLSNRLYAPMTPHTYVSSGKDEEKEGG